MVNGLSMDTASSAVNVLRHFVNYSPIRRGVLKWWVLFRNRHQSSVWKMSRLYHGMC